MQTAEACYFKRRILFLSNREVVKEKKGQNILKPVSLEIAWVFWRVRALLTFGFLKDCEQIIRSQLGFCQ